MGLSKIGPALALYLAEVTNGGCPHYTTKASRHSAAMRTVVRRLFRSGPSDGAVDGPGSGRSLAAHSIPLRLRPQDEAPQARRFTGGCARRAHDHGGRASRPPTADEVFDDNEFLESRPHAHAVLRLPLFRPELHGLVRAGPDGRADRRRPRPQHPATRHDGGHADSRRRRAALPDGHAGRPHLAQDRWPDRPGGGHRRALRGLADGHPQL
ncbi:hypothetical protein D3C85_673140 [compost metagenome]